MIVQEPVQAAIWHCLNHYDYADAVFLSERLYAEVKSDETLYLLATCYYRSGQKTLAYHTLKEAYRESIQCSFLFSVCAYDLEKYADAEVAILETDSGTTRSLDDIVADFGDEAAFAMVLLGKIQVKTERRAKAVETWKRALKINPFLFSAFEALCKIGEKPNPISIFQTDNIENLDMCHGHVLNNVESIVIPTEKIEQPAECLETPSPVLASGLNPNPKYKKEVICSFDESSFIAPNSIAISGLKPLHFTRQKLLCQTEGFESPTFGQFFSTSPNKFNSTPNFRPTNLNFDSNLLVKYTPFEQAEPFINIRNKRDSILQDAKPMFTLSSNVPASTTPNIRSPMHSNINVRRSSRLFSATSVKENNKSSTISKFVTPKSPSRRTKQRLAKNMNNKNADNEINTRNRTSRVTKKEIPETITSDVKNDKTTNVVSENCVQQVIQLQKQNMDGLMTLLRNIGQAYVALSSYDCQTAIQNLTSLPLNQFNTPWVHCLMGLAYFEMEDYKSSIKYFQMVRDQHPHRLDNMEVYSTALWHLQREVGLSALSQDLSNINKNHPITWCVSGNCFSLHKEHDTAIKFFQRAVQTDPNFYYAYTLLGYEYISTEELDKAMSCFENAVRINPMHYNAWFGIGTIYSKQERFYLAERSFSRALSINTQSSVIMCHIAIVQHAMNQPEKALATFNKAIARNPKSPLCRFQRASVYFAMGHHMEALKELEELKQLVPKESSVYYLIGKVHKKLGNTDLALQHFSWATDLDPKGTSQIKEAFDPTIGRNNADMESPQSPTLEEELSAEINAGNQGDGMNFDEVLPDDSEDSTFD